MANMTVSDVKKKAGVPDLKMRSISFTHTAAGTATGSATSTEEIHGTLLRIYTNTDGDDSWDIVLSASGSTIWSRNAFGTGAQTFPLGIMWDAGTPAADTEVTMWGIPLAGETLTVSTANMSGSGTGPVITIVYRAD